MSSVYLAYVTKYGKVPVTDKVKLKLISNQPADPSFLKFIEDLKQSIKVPDIFSSFKKEKNYILFKKASGLHETVLNDFINILDFKDCGTLNRYNQKDLINIEIAKFHHINHY